MSDLVAADLRAHEVAESACGKPDCGVCADYIKTGNPVLRPATREEYLTGLAKSYPNGIPAALRAAADWAEAEQ